jgi:hypothetical protein
MKTLILVGDIFSNFSDRKELVITIEDFRNMITKPLTDNYRIIIGQGISQDDIEQLNDEVNKSNNKKTIFFAQNELLAFQHDKKHQKSVHKHKASNVLVSPPAIVGNNFFHSSIHIQSQCAELSDHTTGQHIQGMIIIEAARQLLLAACENYLLKEESKGKCYFVITNINTNYINFIFPLSAEIYLEVSNLNKTKKGVVLSGNSISTFFQNEIKASEVTINFSAYERSYIFARESSLANSACEELIAATGSQRSQFYG